nr:hypothetical protein [Tanacetum cinerariifolium]
MSLFYQRQCHVCGQPCDGYYCESCTCPQCGMTLFNGICDKKLLKDLKELAEYDQSTSTDRPIFLNDNEDHPRESPENSSEENVVSNSNQEPPQDSDIHQLIEEIPKFNFDFEEEIRLIENLLYDNSFPRPPEHLNAELADTIIESIPLLPIPVQDGNSQQEEIDIVTSSDDVLPPSDENDDDYDFLLGEADLFLSDNSIPTGIENFAD